MASEEIFTGNSFAGRDIKTFLVSQVHERCKQLGKAVVNDLKMDDDEYNFTHQYRGLAIIISNEHFHSTLESRPYADKDIELSNNIFSSLDFLVLRFKDLTAKQMYEVLHAASSVEMDYFNQQADCFACVLASHGIELEALVTTTENERVKHYNHVLFGTYGEVKTRDLVYLFDDSNRKSLRGKPKLFFIQACRSKLGAPPVLRYDTGTDMYIRNDSRRTEVASEIDSSTSSQNSELYNNNIEESIKNSSEERSKTVSIDGQQEHAMSCHDVVCIDILKAKKSTSNDITESLKGSFEKVKNRIKESFHTGKINVSKSEVEILHTTSIPCTNDTLIMYSTTSGKSSFGGEDAGGWMIVMLCTLIQQHIPKLLNDIGRHIDFLKLLTVAMGVVATEFDFATNDPIHNIVKTAITVEHRLTKDIRFRKKYIM